MKISFQFIQHFFGIIIKILSNIILIPMNGIYEKGAIIGNILCSFSTFIIVYLTLRKKVKLNFRLFNLSIKPILVSGIMIISSLYIYKLLIFKNVNINICTIISIIIAIALYLLGVFVTKMLNKNQILENLDKTG